jgi:hypothetical protein
LIKKKKIHWTNPLNFGNDLIPVKKIVYFLTFQMTIIFILGSVLSTRPSVILSFEIYNFGFTFIFFIFVNNSLYFYLLFRRTYSISLRIFYWNQCILDVYSVYIMS